MQGARSGVVVDPGQRYFVGWNRSVIRGPVWFAAAFLIIFSIIEWPGLFIGALSLIVALALIGAGVWAQYTFPEVLPEGVPATGEPLEAETNEPD